MCDGGSVYDLHVCVEVRCCGSSPAGKPRALPVPLCSWPELQGCPLSEARWKGRSKDGPALPLPAGQVSHRTQETGVGGGDVSSARWGWGPNPSEEPWMNQPNHSRPNCSDGDNKLFVQPPLQHSFSFPFAPQTQALAGCGTRAVAKGKHLWSWWLSWVLMLELQP